MGIFRATVTILIVVGVVLGGGVVVAIWLDQQVMDTSVKVSLSTISGVLFGLVLGKVVRSVTRNFSAS